MVEGGSARSWSHHVSIAMMKWLIFSALLTNALVSARNVAYPEHTEADEPADQATDNILLESPGLPASYEIKLPLMTPPMAFGPPPSTETPSTVHQADTPPPYQDDGTAPSYLSYQDDPTRVYKADTPPPVYQHDTVPVYKDETLPLYKDDIPPVYQHDTVPVYKDDTPPVYKYDTLPSSHEDHTASPPPPLDEFSAAYDPDYTYPAKKLDAKAMRAIPILAKLQEKFTMLKEDERDQLIEKAKSYQKKFRNIIGKIDRETAMKFNLNIGLIKKILALENEKEPKDDLIASLHMDRAAAPLDQHTQEPEESEEDEEEEDTGAPVKVKELDLKQQDIVNFAVGQLTAGDSIACTRRVLEVTHFTEQVIEGMLYSFNLLLQGVGKCPQVFTRCSMTVLDEPWESGKEVQWDKSTCRRDQGDHEDEAAVGQDNDIPMIMFPASMPRPPPLHPRHHHHPYEADYYPLPHHPPTAKPRLSVVPHTAWPRPPARHYRADSDSGDKAVYNDHHRRQGYSHGAGSQDANEDIATGETLHQPAYATPYEHRYSPAVPYPFPRANSPQQHPLPEPVYRPLQALSQAPGLLHRSVPLQLASPQLRSAYNNAQPLRFVHRLQPTYLQPTQPQTAYSPQPIYTPRQFYTRQMMQPGYNRYNLIPPQQFAYLHPAQPGYLQPAQQPSYAQQQSAYLQPAYPPQHPAYPQQHPAYPQQHPAYLQPTPLPTYPQPMYPRPAQQPAYPRPAYPPQFTANHLPPPAQESSTDDLYTEVEARPILPSSYHPASIYADETSLPYLQSIMQHDEQEESTEHDLEEPETMEEEEGKERVVPAGSEEEAVVENVE